MNKPAYPHPIIAREGWPFAAGIIILAILASFWTAVVAVPLWLIAIFVVQFFRDPSREAPDGEGIVLSPADGRIVAVEEVRDVYADRDAIKISVFMNVFNVHSNRSPVKAAVQAITYFPGQFFNASLDKASLENERNATVLRTPQGHLITAVQVAGLVAKRILCYIKPGDLVYAGQRYGFIRFGSRVDVYLPLGSRPRVAIGDKVQATSTVLAELPQPVSDADADTGTRHAETAISEADTPVPLQPAAPGVTE